jgi:hypothetical protein
VAALWLPHPQHADDRTAPTAAAAAIVHAARDAGKNVSRQQVSVVEAIATSGCRLDLLVGPAGAGKTTTLRVLREAWIETHGRNSVIGLAPSAAAAQVLGAELTIACENTAKWFHDYPRGRTELRRDQLVIIDEATLADTRTLDHITAAAASAGAKVLLVGDWAQLPSVGAGGAFAMLAEARTDTPELVDVHRFTREWEKTATLALRIGDIDVIDTYISHGRIHEGTTEDMIDTAYAAWRTDIGNGLDSILITQSTDAMHQLNTQARADRILAGTTQAGREAHLAGDARASTGDVVITRRNDRKIRDLRGNWVRNGERWRVIDARSDGTLHVQRPGQRVGASVVLPAGYVTEHVELGYAVTAHRAQGLTVDTSHTLATTSTTRENLYVAMTRGRESNTCYVAIDQPDELHHTPPAEGATARSVLCGILQHTGAELSAHQSITAEQEHWSSIAQLAAEYETLAAAAQNERWTALIRSCGLTDEQACHVIASRAFGPLAVALRRAEANGHDIDDLLPRLVARYPLADADDIAAVLHHRVGLAASRPARDGRAPRFVAGLVPEAQGDMTDEHRQALS